MAQEVAKPSGVRLDAADKRILGVVLVVIVGFVATIPLLSSNLPFPGHDLTFHLARISSIAEGLKHGVFPVMLYADQAYGMGYPTGLYYPSAFLYFPALLVVAGCSLKTAYIVFVLAANMATSALAYACFAKVFRSRRVGAALCVLWTFSVYRLMDVFVRASVGEYLSLAFLPLIAFGLWKVFLDDGSPDGAGWCPLGIGIVCVVHSHILSTVLFAAVGLVALVPCIALRKKRRCALALAKAAALALALSLGFLVPFLAGYMGSDLAVKVASSGYYGTLMADSAVEPAQVLSPFLAFRGGSEELGTGPAADMPLGVGWALLGTLAVLTAVALVPGLRKELSRDSLAWAAFLGVFAVVLLFLATYLAPWWLGLGDGLLAAVVRRTYVLQFPWRLLGLASFLLVLLAGVLLSRCAREAARLLGYSLVMVSIVECGFACGTYVNNATPYDLDQVGTLPAAGDGEYYPAELDASRIEQNGPDAVVGTSSDDVTSVSFERVSAQEVAVTASNGSDDAQTVTLPVIWQNWYEVSGTSGEGADAHLVDDGGYLAISLAPHSEGTYAVAFSEPLLWRLAEAASLLTLIAVAARAVVVARRGRGA